MSNDSGLPKNAKVWRLVVYLPTEGGDKRHPFPSELMTQLSANALLMEHNREGRKDCEVVLDQAAALAYQAKHGKKWTAAT